MLICLHPSPLRGYRGLPVCPYSLSPSAKSQSLSLTLQCLAEVFLQVQLFLTVRLWGKDNKSISYRCSSAFCGQRKKNRWCTFGKQRLAASELPLRQQTFSFWRSWAVGQELLVGRSRLESQQKIGTQRHKLTAMRLNFYKPNEQCLCRIINWRLLIFTLL